MFNEKEVSVVLGDKTLSLKTGHIARQANSVVAQMGETVVLCTVVAANAPKDGIDFFPLTVHYQERYYASGKFPGSFHRREAKPSEAETLIARSIDRPIRPLFPEHYFNEVQIICTTLAYDKNVQPDILAIAGASAALALSGIPFQGPVAGIRVGYKDGEYLLNPSKEVTASSELDLLVAGTKDAVLMVESEAKELSEEVMLGAVAFGHENVSKIIDAINDLASDAKPTHFESFDDKPLLAKLRKLSGKALEDAYRITAKLERYTKIDAIYNSTLEQLVAEDETIDSVLVKMTFKKLESDILRTKLLKEGIRVDDRNSTQIRPIVSEIDVLPKVVHGSALFTRGETQALVVTTLGTTVDEQIIDDLDSVRKEHFLLHYNFPPYSVGEVGAMRGVGRREIGHGNLAMRAIRPLMPSKEDFPYSIRVVSEITESNGSSSMATVCGASLSLWSAGVPLKDAVAGIAMGLIMDEKGKYVVLSDINGTEDHLGDMDFKVAGTKNGITALQMDIKIAGIDLEIMKLALAQAKDGRMHILEKMAKAITSVRQEFAPSAPRIESIKINKDRIGELIGPGGKVIKEITEKSGAKIDILEDGTVNVASNNNEAITLAISMINSIIFTPEIGSIYPGVVTRMLDFGVVVAIAKNADGMVHISEMSQGRINKPSDIVKEGDKVQVKVIDIEKNGRIKLSMKGLNAIAVSESAQDGDEEEIVDEVDEESESANEAPFQKEARDKRRAGNKSRNSNRNDSLKSDKANKKPREAEPQASSPIKKKRFF